MAFDKALHVTSQLIARYSREELVMEHARHGIIITAVDRERLIEVLPLSHEHDDRSDLAQLGLQGASMIDRRETHRRSKLLGRRLIDSLACVSDQRRALRLRRRRLVARSDELLDSLARALPIDLATARRQTRARVCGAFLALRGLRLLGLTAQCASDVVGEGSEDSHAATLARSLAGRKRKRAREIAP
jgi:hypothetical protein